MKGYYGLVETHKIKEINILMDLHKTTKRKLLAFMREHPNREGC